MHPGYWVSQDYFDLSGLLSTAAILVFIPEIELACWNVLSNLSSLLKGISSGK